MERACDQVLKDRCAHSLLCAAKLKTQHQTWHWVAEQICMKNTLSILCFSFLSILPYKKCLTLHSSLLDLGSDSVQTTPIPLPSRWGVDNELIIDNG